MSGHTSASWTYVKMSGLDPQPINSVFEKELGLSNKSRGTRPVVEVHKKQEIQKLLEFCFIKLIQHPA